MADFERELTELFEAQVDPSVGPPLADVAVARIQQQDQGRSLALTSAAILGVAAAGSVVGASGAVQAVRLLFTEAVAKAPHAVSPAVWWSMAAVIIAAGAVQALRTARAF
jgi:hypothetical protein